MKICYLCADRGITLAKHKGASTHIRSIVRAFVAGGHDVVVVMPPGDAKNDLGVPLRPIIEPEIFAPLTAEQGRERDGQTKDLRKNRIRVTRALGHIWQNAAVEKTFGTVIREFSPDLIYERYSPFGIAGGVLANRYGIPHVLEVNAPLAWEGAEYRKQALQEAAEVLELNAFEFSTRIVAVSRELRDQLVAGGVAAEKIVIVPNGVDPDLFDQRGPRYRNGLDAQFVLGFVGSLKEWHGMDVLAEAFESLAHDPRFHLLIVGDGPTVELFRALADRWPGQVTITGEIPLGHVPQYVRAMDVALAPYPPLERFYFSPLKVLEYMAAGRPVVASAIGQVAELIRDGETGLLVPPGDVSALTAAVRRLASDRDLRLRLGALAAREIRQRHTWTQRASDILASIEVREQAQGAPFRLEGV